MDKYDKNIRKLLNDASFVAWSLGEADRETAVLWDEWVEKSKVNRRQARIAQNIIADFEIKPDHLGSDLKYQAWAKLDDRIHTAEPFYADDLNGLPSRRKGREWYYSVAAAAVFLIIFVSIAGYWRSLHMHRLRNSDSGITQMKTVSTEYGEQKTVELSDGSHIVLNANSSITYYDGWVHEKTVKVHLSGEALFSVSERSSPDDPAFRVSTSDGDITVLGTRFSVSTRQEATQVVLEEGSLEISRAQDIDNGIQLKPDEMARFNKKETLGVQQVNTRVYTSWVKNLFVFDQTPLQKVIERIEHTYGMQVKVENESLLERKLSGAIESKNLKVLMSALSKTLKTSVTKEDDRIIIGKENKKDASSN